MKQGTPFAFALLLLGCPTQAPEPPPPAGEGCQLRSSPPLEIVLTDVAADLGVQDAGSINNGLAVEDFDGDGDLDIYAANTGPGPKLFMQQDDGSYLEHPAAPSIGYAPAASSVDFDNDGDADLYLSCGFWDDVCPNGLFRNDGNDAAGWPIFVDVTDSFGIADPNVSTFGGSWADFDGDGDLDLFQACKRPMGVPGVDSSDQLWRNDGDTFTEIGAAAGVDGDGDSHQAAWIDFDADGWPDLFVPTLAGPNVLYRNNSDGTFSDVTPAFMREPFSAFAVVAADFNQDGWQDLLVSGTSEEWQGQMELEEHGLFINDGQGGFEDWTFGTGLNAEGNGAWGIGTMGLQVGDLDLDGFPDVVFGDGDPDGGEVNAMGSFVPDGDGITWVNRTGLIDSPGQGDAAGMPPYPFRTHGMAMVDLDGDFDTDIFMGNGGGSAWEPNQLWRNDTATRNHGLRVRLVGVTDNRQGLGARIRLSDGPEGASTWATYGTVRSTSGFNSSRPATVTIGAGQCGGPYHVSVRWPNGTMQELADVPETTETLVVEQE